LAETFVHTPTPCILHKYSCVLTDILYEFVYLVKTYIHILKDKSNDSYLHSLESLRTKF